jgi:hypothetical protein
MREENDIRKFLVTYLAPASVIDDWKKTEPSKERLPRRKCRGIGESGWPIMRKHLPTREQVSARRNVSPRKVLRIPKNDIMLYSVVEADSHQAAAKMFEKHPHLGIPHASIEIMEIHPLGM